MFLKIKKYLFLDDVFNMSLHVIPLFFFLLFNQFNILFSTLNILTYICLSVFQFLFLDVINDYLFIYLFSHIILSSFDYMCA